MDYAEKIRKEIAEEEKRLQQALKKNRELGDGLKIGKIFRVRVADGYSFYEITDIKKDTVKIKWRKDLCIDNYMDSVLYNGGYFPKNSIERLMKWEDEMSKIFGRK